MAVGIGWIITAGLISFNVSTFNVGTDVHGLAVKNGEVFVAGKRGTICRFRPEDMTKEPPSCVSVGHYLITSIDFNGEKGIAAGERAKIYLTEDGGMTWRDVSPAGMRYHILDVEWIDEKRVMAVGDWGTILWSEDGGRSWEERPLKRKYDPAEWVIPVLASDVKDPETGKIYRKGEEISQSFARKLVEQGVDVWIRYDIILNDAMKVASDEVVITGERGRVFIINVDSWHVKETSVVKLVEEDSLFEEAPTVFFITGENGRWFAGGSQGNVFFAESFKGPWKKVSFPWDQADTIFSGSTYGSTVCLSGLYGTIIFSFDGGKSWKRYISETTRIKWFRRAAALKEGVCAFGGEGETFVIISK